MSEATKAVFLSYASQDAEAAKRICESLRSGGVEVWFDQEGGLEHGDEWDQKIRRQIKDCVLFIALISANTQARHEGYFRIEWELAAQRAMGIASGVPFILPVVIDDTREPEALVPDRFRAVQWMKLPGGVVPVDVQVRFLKLWSHRTSSFAKATEDRAGGLPSEASAKEGGRTAENGKPIEVGRPPVRQAQGRWLRGRPVWIGALALGLAIAGLLVWKLAPRTAVPTEAARRPAFAQGFGGPGTAQPASEAEQLAAKARAIYLKIGFSRDDLTAAEDLARRATELDSTSATTWGTRAGVHSAYLLRNWDLSEKRRQDTQALANRALALNPDEPEALLALSWMLTRQNAFDQAEAILRRALGLWPEENRIRRLLGVVLGIIRPDEGQAVLEDAVRRFPRDVLARYDLGQHYYTQVARGRSAAEAFGPAMEQLDAALAVQPFGGALTLKALLSAGTKGDLVAMRAALDSLSPADRVEDRAVFTAMWCGLMERKPERVFAAGALTARNYFEDNFIYSGPKVWPIAQAHRLAGQDNLARLDWEAAERLLRQRLAGQPDNLIETAQLATTLAWLGRGEEAAKVLAPIEAAWREQMNGRRGAPYARGARQLALHYAALGDVAQAVPYIRVAINRSPMLSTATLRLDPWWDKLRGQAEFEALLSEKESGAGGKESGARSQESGGRRETDETEK